MSLSTAVVVFFQRCRVASSARLESIMRRQGLIAGKGVYVSVMLVVGIAILDAVRQQTVAPPQEQVTPPTWHATLEGTWNLNVAASSATGDLGPGVQISELLDN